MPKQIKTTLKRTVKIVATAKLRARSEFHVTASPKLLVRDAVAAMDFYAQAFGAVEVERWTGLDGSIPNLQFSLGEAHFALKQYRNRSEADALGSAGSHVSFDLLVPKVDAVVRRAVQLGATIQYPVEDRFFGQRKGGVVDPFGFVWHIASPIPQRGKQMAIRSTPAQAPGKASPPRKTRAKSTLPI